MHPFCPNGANVIYRNSADRFLVVQDIKTMRWQLPGGGVEKGESFDTTAARELFEETGYCIFEDELVRMADFKQKARNPTTGELVDGICRLYVANRLYGELRREPNSEIARARFMSYDEIMDMDRRDHFNIGYIRMILHYLRWRNGLTPVSFTARLAEKIEEMLPMTYVLV